MAYKGNIEGLLDPREVERIVDSLKLGSGDSFECYGKKYAMWLCPACACDEPECFWSPSTACKGGIDIYLISEIPDDFKRAVLVHEIVETAAYPMIGDMFEAHLLARTYDTAYARSHFDDRRLEEFLNLDSFLVELKK